MVVKIKQNLLFLSGLSFILFVFLSFLVFLGKLNNFDNSFTLFLQNHLSKSFDPFLSLLSLLGSVEVTTAVFFLIIVFYLKIFRGIYPVVFYLISTLIELVGKSIIYHPGPPANYFRYDLGFLFPSSYIETNYSYPSGHALRTSFILGLLIYILLRNNRLSKLTKKILVVASAVFFLLMLASRISLGEHWLSDVIAGSLLGVSFSLLAIRSLRGNK